MRIYLQHWRQVFGNAQRSAFHRIYYALHCLRFVHNSERNRELKVCLHKLSIVDDTLEALGMPKEYQCLRNWIIRIIIGWIVLVFFDNAVCSFFLNYYYYEYFNIVCIYIPFVINYVHHVNILSALTSGAIIGLVYLYIYFIRAAFY
ncbi:hypothetical protein ALC56_06335 [Trachymyrmex septentrionalis]|uniref:Uncharacterized protein n=1 Tax=Trachymyrmex septentrionalis TaxID=34720 RepID=A0A195FGX6_9HYME|nr:hypothetical protein ALC56_06335 [Trachymyrmex septentrionalis]